MVTYLMANASIRSLEDWMQQAPERTEWVNGELIEKVNTTLRQSKIQAEIAYFMDKV
jgi:hypothetical protein